MQNRDGINRGYFCAWLFAVTSACRDVWGKAILQSIPIQFVLLLAFSGASVAGLVWMRFHPTIGEKVKGRETEVAVDSLLLNLTTLFAWIGAFEGLSQLLPITLASLGIGTIPIATIVLNRFLRNVTITKASLLNAGLVVLGMGIICIREASFMKNVSLAALVPGILWSIAGGAFAAANNVYARRLNDKGYTAAEVFARRFALLILASATWCALNHDRMPTTVGLWGSAVLLGIVGVSIPIMSIQYAIQMVGAGISGFVIASVPAIVFILELCFLPERKDILSLVSSCIGLGIVAIGIYSELSTKHPAKNLK